MMNKLLYYSVIKISDEELFKFGADPILLKSYEDDIKFTLADLTKCHFKSELIQKSLELQFEQVKIQNKKKMTDTDTIYNFEKNEEFKKQMAINEQSYQKQIDDQEKLQIWLDQAINQNIGIFKINDTSFIYDSKSLYLFSYKNKFRKCVVYLTEQQWFDLLVINLILFSSIVSAIESSKTNKKEESSQNLEMALQFCNVFFIFEGILKIIAQGLLKHKNSYLRNGWNIIDFIVVVSSTYEILSLLVVEQNGYKINFMRLFRVLRPLRSVKRVPSMRRLVSIMLRSLPELVNTLIFMLFFFIVFGIIGIQTFYGAIYNRCRLTEAPVDGLWEMDPLQSDIICSEISSQCREGTFCGSPIKYIETHQSEFEDPFMGDKPWEDERIQYNTVNFNNILIAVVTIFEALTLEGWSTQMNNLSESGNGTLSVIFYLMLVTFGSYFILNLILAVIMGSFTKFEKQEIENSMKDAQLEGEFADLHKLLNSDKMRKQEAAIIQYNSKESSRNNTDNDKMMVEMGNKNFLEIACSKNLLQVNNQTFSKMASSKEPVAKNLEDKSSSDEEDFQKKPSKNIDQFIQNVDSDKESVLDSELKILSKSEQAKSYQTENSKNEDLVPKSHSSELVIQSENSKEKPLAIDNRSEILSKNSEKLEKSQVLSKRSSILQNTQDLNNRRQSQHSRRTEPELEEEQKSFESQLQISNESAYSNYQNPPKHVSYFSKYEIQPEKFKEIEADEFKEGGGDDSAIISSRNDMTTHTLIQNVSQRGSVRVQQTPGDKIIQPIKMKKNRTFAHNEANHHHLTYKTKKSYTDKLKQKLEHKVSLWEMKWGAKYKDSPIQVFFYKIVQSKLFLIIISLAILVNTISMSLDRYPIDPKESAIIEKINTITTWIFVTELVIKVLGLGIKTYASDSMNQFDAIVVIISLVEFILQETQNKEGNQEQLSLTIFRAFRLLRGLRLFRKWKTFHKMMIKIGQTLKDILTFFVLLLIIVFVFSLLGVELFANKIKMDQNNQIVALDDPKGKSPLQNFDNIMEAFVTVFVCLIGEDWQFIMHDYERANQSRWLPCFYFIFLMIVGHLFLMNLFLAILLKNFEEQNQSSRDELEAEESEEKNSINLNKSFSVAFKSMKVKLKRVAFKKESNMVNPEFEFEHQEHQVVPHQHTAETIVIDSVREPHQEKTEPQKSPSDAYFEGGSDVNLEGGDQQFFKYGNKKRRNTIAKSYIEIMSVKKKRMSKQQSMMIENQNFIVLKGKALYIFNPENRLRVLLSKLISHRFFEMFIFLVVVVSIICLGLEDPLESPDARFSEYIQIANNIIFVIFIAELIIKVIVYGLVLGPGTYMRNGWNLLDAVIVLTSIISFIFENTLENQTSAAKQLSLFKMLRVLRTLRMISRNEGLRLSMLSLIYSLPGIMNVSIVTLLFYILFGIFFLNLLKGKFYHCVLPDQIVNLVNMNLLDTKYDCINLGGQWANKYINFDDIPNALLALYTMSTTEGWVIFMNEAVDSRGIGLEPKTGSNPFYKIIFIIYMVFGSLFITNLFIEVVINTFHTKKRQLDRNYALTNFQNEWIQLQIKCYNAKPETKIYTQSDLRKFCIKIVEHEYFDPLIMVIICFNTIALMLVWIGINHQIAAQTEFSQNLFNIIFIIECALKLIAYQKSYFYEGWNVFDFIIVLGGVGGLLIQSRITANLSVIRIIRVCRILRLLKKAKRLYIIFIAFQRTIPAFMNVGGLIMVLIYIFTVIGSRLFSKIKVEGSTAIDDKHKNFQTFGNSFLTLIIVMTGEGWYEIMEDYSRQGSIDSECISNPSYQDYVDNDYKTLQCGKKGLSILFFCSYVFIVSLILLNLFIAVTLQGFNDVSSEDTCRITDYHLQTFVSTWRNIDHEGTGFIHISEAACLLRNLIDNKCELFPPNVKALAYDQTLLPKLIESMQLKLYKKFQYYNFHDILISLSQMYIYYLANREHELAEIFDEFNELHINEGFPPGDLDDIIEHIEQIQQEKNVQLCIELDKTFDKFKYDVLDKIDRFEGNIYNSSMIPIIIKIQQKFRQGRMQRIKEEMNENIFKKFKKEMGSNNKSATKNDSPLKVKEESVLKKLGTVGKLLQFKLKRKDSLSEQDIIFRDKYSNELEQYTLQQLIDLQKDLKKQQTKEILHNMQIPQPQLDFKGLSPEEVQEAIKMFIEQKTSPLESGLLESGPQSKSLEEKISSTYRLQPINTNIDTGNYNTANMIERYNCENQSSEINQNQLSNIDSPKNDLQIDDNNYNTQQPRQPSRATPDAEEQKVQASSFAGFNNIDSEAESVINRSRQRGAQPSQKSKAEVQSVASRQIDFTFAD